MIIVFIIAIIGIIIICMREVEICSKKVSVGAWHSATLQALEKPPLTERLSYRSYPRGTDISR